MVINHDAYFINCIKCCWPVWQESLFIYLRRWWREVAMKGKWGEVVDPSDNKICICECMSSHSSINHESQSVVVGCTKDLYSVSYSSWEWLRCFPRLGSWTWLASVSSKHLASLFEWFVSLPSGCAVCYCVTYYFQQEMNFKIHLPVGFSDFYVYFLI